MIIGKQFKKDQNLVKDFFENADQDVKKALANTFAASGSITITQDSKEFTLTPDMISFSEETRTS
jgi:hypothetical protein